MSAIFGETLIFGQHAGPAVPLVVFGDEFYARYENTAGYTVLYDMDRGVYCYADLDQEGRFVSSGVSMAKPAPWDLRRHLRESARVRNDKFNATHARFRPPEAVGESFVMRTLGPNDGLLTGRRNCRGSVRGLTILVGFADQGTDVTADDVKAMLNHEDYQGNGNYCSVRRYYQLMSSGALDFENDVVGPVRLRHRQSHYINNPLMAEALELAVDLFGVDLSRYDSRGEGIVDALSFVYAGRTLYKNWLWPHNSVLHARHGGVRTHYYTIQSVGRRAIDLSIGTFAHEAGHMLCRFPDLYDYGKRDGDFEQSSGLGNYCLMSGGNHLGGGKTPAPICVYLRDLVGWCNQEVRLDRPGRYTARHGDYATVMRYPTDQPNEYFLVENRSRMGLDRYLPSSGLAVFHCDTLGSNEWQDGTLERHYQCALLQADGHRDLENDFNTGDLGDLFDAVEGRALGDETKPSSRAWDGTDTGFVLRNISAPGESISFAAGREPVGAKTSVEISARPDLLIPDDDENGILSSVDVERAGRVVALGLSVDITHSYRGDLEVALVAPGGQRVLVHRKSADPIDDLRLELDSRDGGDLAGLVGADVGGRWTLEVRDLVRSDVGRLDAWGLHIEMEPSQEVFERETRPAAEIPDDNTGGIESTFRIESEARVTDVQVDLDISHSYVGDLQVELRSPAGKVALLHAASGRQGNHLVGSFTPERTPTLRGLLGDPAGGTWTLHVRDLLHDDTGRLERWKLRVTAG